MNECTQSLFRCHSASYCLFLSISISLSLSLSLQNKKKRTSTTFTISPLIKLTTSSTKDQSIRLDLTLDGLYPPPTTTRKNRRNQTNLLVKMLCYTIRYDSDRGKGLNISQNATCFPGPEITDGRYHCNGQNVESNISEL